MMLPPRTPTSKWVRYCVGERFTGSAQATDPEDAALQQEDRALWHLVEPSLLAEIEYRAKSAEGKVRHPFFKGIREDL
jgi:ATP-dependent DNA ligase